MTGWIMFPVRNLAIAVTTVTVAVVGVGAMASMGKPEIQAEPAYEAAIDQAIDHLEEAERNQERLDMFLVRMDMESRAYAARTYGQGEGPESGQPLAQDVSVLDPLGTLDGQKTVLVHTATTGTATVAIDDVIVRVTSL